MSPLATAPNRGYPDWQRVGNYDTGVLWSQQGTNVSGSFQSPILDVSRFARLGGVFQCPLNQYQVTVSYYADAGAITPVGTRSWVLGNQIPDYCFPLLINMGPFARITLANPAGGNYSYSVAVVATNRDHPLEFIPINPVILDVQFATIGAGATLNDYPSDYYSGPVSYWWSGISNGGLAFKYLTANGVWDEFFQTLAPASGSGQGEVTTPAGIWRCEVTNLAGVSTNYYLSLVPSTTGAT